MSNDLTPIPRPHFVVPAVGEQDIYQSWLAGKKSTTLRAYEGDVDDFRQFLGAMSGREAIAILTGGTHGFANAIALSYRTHLAARGLKSATICRRLAALRSLVKLARTLGIVSWSLEIASPKTEPFRDTTGPGDAGWRRVLDQAKTEAGAGGEIGIRNLALVRLLHDLGLRRAEVVSLDLADVDVAAGTVSVLGKGRTERATLSMPAPVRAAMAGWLAVRGPEEGALFRRLDRGAVTPERLTADGVYKVVGELGRRAGLTKRLRPHGLRHQAVTAVLDRNHGDLRAAARFSRHKNLQTLVKYDDNRQDLAGQMADLISDE